MKRAAKELTARTLGRLTASSTDRVVVLCYHSVHPSLPYASVTPALFAEHLDWLQSQCDVIPLGQVTASLQAPRSSRPLVAITFDDGYEDNYTYAFPLLAERGCPATFFVTVGLVDGDPASIARLSTIRQVAPSEIRPLAWGQILEMRSAGLSIGAHTWSHPNLARLGEAEVRLELSRPKEMLEDRLGEAITSFAYPFGKPGRHFTQSTVELVAEEGYAMAVSVLFRAVRAGDAPFAIPRFFVSGDRLETLAAKIGGRWDWLGLWQERIPDRLARLVSPSDFRV